MTFRDSDSLRLLNVTLDHGDDDGGPKDYDDEWYMAKKILALFPP